VIQWILFGLLCGLISGRSEAAFESAPTGPRTRALGGAGSALGGDSWGGLRNPALIRGNGFSVGANWSQAFGLPELNREYFGAARDLKPISLGLHASSFGSELYRESAFDLIFAREIREEVTAGIAVGFRSLSTRGYARGNAAAVSLGLVARPISRLAIAGVWRQLNRGKLDGYEDRLPESLVIGFAAELGPSTMAVLDFIAESHFPLETRLGLESRVSKRLKLRIGGRAEPFRPSGGFQIIFRRWKFHYGGDLHPDLGPTHSVGMEMRIGE
jgi:hypothetical protein